MTNITLDGLPAKTGTISDSGIIHYREAGVDKKMTVADFLIRISEEYSTDINTFLGAADKAAGRAALEIARRTPVNNSNYTIIATDKVVAQTGTMTAARTFTLPSAALYPAGEELIIIDQSGTVTPANKISVARSSTDTIDGYTSKDITSAYGFLRLISNGSNSWKIAGASPATSTNPITIANNTTDANNDIDFSAGNAPLDDGSDRVLLTSTLVKRLDASWVAGTNQGGLFSGTKANSTRYYLFAITNGTINDAGFDISPTGANIPAGYKGSYRGMVLTNSSGNILAFEQLKNNYFEFITSILEGSGTTPSTRTPLPVSAPENVIVKINATLSSVAAAGSVNHLYLTDLNKTDTTSVIKLFANANFGSAGEFTVKTNSSSQIGIRGNGPSGTYEIFTLGFFDINIKN